MAVIWSSSSVIVSDGWVGYQFRNILPTAALTSPGANSGQIRCTVTTDATGSGSTNFDAVWIGPGITSPVYNFDGTQVQLTFSGATFFNAVGPSTSIVTDFVPFTFNFSSAVSLVTAIHISGTGGDLVRTADLGASGYDMQYQLMAAGQEGSTAPTGTFTNAGGFITAVTSIEMIISTPANPFVNIWISQ